ncbi:MAG: hypothetical protein ACLUE2_09000 [Bacteroides cellulosilyticus]
MKSTDSNKKESAWNWNSTVTGSNKWSKRKSKDLIAIQENLEATNRRQALFIKYCKYYN